MCFHHLTKWLRPFIAILFIFSTTSYAADSHIATSAFTTTGNKHKASDVIQQLNNDVKKIYFFTDFRNFQGQTLTHQWAYNGWVAQSIPFEIKGNRWRVSSNKSLKPRGKGTWTVKVLDETGKVIQKNTISYDKKSTQASQSEIKTSEEKDNKKEVKKETKYATAPKTDAIPPVTKKDAKTKVEKEEKKEKEQKKKENTEESSQKPQVKKENNTKETEANKDKKIAKTEKSEVKNEATAKVEKPKEEAKEIAKVEKSEEKTETSTTEKDKNATTESTKKVASQNNSTETPEVKRSISPLNTVTESDSSEKDSEDHIGDCDDDEDMKSVGKQQVRDE